MRQYSESALFPVKPKAKFFTNFRWSNGRVSESIILLLLSPVLNPQCDIKGLLIIQFLINMIYVLIRNVL